MEKVTFTTHSIEFDLSDSELRKAVMMYLHEKNHILSDNISIHILKKGGCRVTTIHSKKVEKVEECK